MQNDLSKRKAESDLSISRFQVIVLFQRQLRIQRNYNAPDDENAVDCLLMEAGKSRSLGQRQGPEFPITVKLMEFTPTKLV